MDIMCRKLGYGSLTAADSMNVFNTELKNHVDTASGISAFMGKKALPKLTVDLFIIDWDSPPGGIVSFIRDLKSKYSGRYNFIVVADKKHTSSLDSALKAGAYDCLVKPFQISEFKEKVNEALSGREKLLVQSFNLVAASDASKKQGFGQNPFAVQKEEAPAEGKKAVESKPVKPQEKRQATPTISHIETKPVDRPPPPVSRPARSSVGGRSSFYGSKSAAARRSDTPTATLIDGKINGHYHQKVDVIGGGENCYWARETAVDKVRLEYLSAKGEPTGMEAKVIDRDDFMHIFYLCEEHGCNILRQLGKWPLAE